MKIIKRSGAEAIFDANKIAQAVKKANDSVVEAERLSHHQIAHIVEKVEKQCLAVNRSLNVEEIQDLVENAIMREQAFSVARNMREAKLMRQSWTGLNVMHVQAVEHALLSELHQPCRLWQKR